MKPVFHKNELEKKIDFFSQFRLQKRESLLFWLRWSGGCIGVLVVVLGTMLLFVDPIIPKPTAHLSPMPEFVALLGELGTVMPAGTWLETIECDCGTADGIGTVTLIGYSSMVEQVVQLYQKLCAIGRLSDTNLEQQDEGDRVGFTVMGRVPSP